MKHFKVFGVAVAIVVLGFFSSTRAQFGYDPLLAQLDAHSRQIDAWIEQQMQAAQQRSDQAFANLRRSLIDYYRKHTGDWLTSDDLAFQYGDRLYCHHHPVACQQMFAAGHAANMADTTSWGNTMSQIARDSSSILDASHEGFLNRGQMQDQGQANWVQGVIHGESTFYGPSAGTGMSLPVQPDPFSSYATPHGNPLAFDFNTGTWFQGDGFGGWIPLHPAR